MGAVEEPMDATGEPVACDVESGEKDRFYSRLATIPGVRTLPSIGDWILLRVPEPTGLARKVNRRMEPGAMSVPRNVPGTVRIHVRDAKTNDALFRTIRDLVV